MRRYMHETGWQHKDFAPFSINAHANAMQNPFARFHMEINEEKYLNAGMICDPINLMDASPIGDGAAAIVLVPAEKVSGKVIRVVGSAAATDTIAVHDRKDPTWLTAAEKSSKKAYAQAGLSAPDIDFFEYHDAFTIMAALSLEACGFVERGKGPSMAVEGQIGKNGRLPVATMGGLKARGHPVGATGVYQLVEVIQQLRGTAGKNQLEKAQVGGSGSNIITHILRND
jgi:acetyl-CoA C-acetyltransferase